MTFRKQLFQTTISYVPNAAGGGKTTALIHWARHQIQAGKKLLIVQPTAALIDATMTEIGQIGSPANFKAIHSGIPEHKDHVRRDIMAHFAKASPLGEALFITQEAFRQIPFLKNRKDWILIFDEVPPFLSPITLPLPENHRLLTDHIDLQDVRDRTYVRIVPKDGSGNHLKRIAEGKTGDAVDAVLRPVAAALISKHADVFIHDKPFEELESYLAVMRPEIVADFHQVIMMGANFTNSLLYRAWSNPAPGTGMDAVRFIPFSDPNFKPRYAAHQNGHLVNIHCYVEDLPWSKTLRNKNAGLIAHIEQDAKTVIGDDGILVQANNDIADDLDWNSLEASRIANYVHGRNDFQHYHHGIFTAANNLRPDAFRFLKDMYGLSGDEIRAAVGGELLYQSVCRTSIRNPDNPNEKHIFVPTRQQADQLASLIPGSTVNFRPGFQIVGNKPGRPHTGKSERERQQERDEHKAKVSAHLKMGSGQKITRKVLDRFFDQDQIDQYATARQILGNKSWGYTRHDSIFDPAKYDLSFDTFDDMAETFRCYHEASKDVGLAKEDASAFTTGLFTGKRGVDTFAFASHIILDFDEGELSPEGFRDIFKDTSFFIYSSYSNSAKACNWRAVIECDCLMTDFIYKLIVRSIVKRMADAGYYGHSVAKPGQKVHGLCCTTPKMAYYMPNSSNDPGAAFFIRNEGAPICVHLTAKKVGYRSKDVRPPASVSSAPTASAYPSASSEADAIFDVWDVPGYRHNELMATVNKLQRFGPAEMDRQLRKMKPEHRRDALEISKRKY